LNSCVTIDEEMRRRVLHPFELTKLVSRVVHSLLVLTCIIGGVVLITLSLLEKYSIDWILGVVLVVTGFLAMCVSIFIEVYLITPKIERAKQWLETEPLFEWKKEELAINHLLPSHRIQENEEQAEGSERELENKGEGSSSEEETSGEVLEVVEIGDEDIEMRRYEIILKVLPAVFSLLIGIFVGFMIHRSTTNSPVLGLDKIGAAHFVFVVAMGLLTCITLWGAVAFIMSRKAETNYDFKITNKGYFWRNSLVLWDMEEPDTWFCCLPVPKIELQAVRISEDESSITYLHLCYKSLRTRFHPRGYFSDKVPVPVRHVEFVRAWVAREDAGGANRLSKGNHAAWVHCWDALEGEQISL